MNNITILCVFIVLKNKTKKLRYQTTKLIKFFTWQMASAFLMKQFFHCMEIFLRLSFCQDRNINVLYLNITI